MTLKTFLHSGELYIRVIPSKKLFNSTLIHEVVNRGDVFALRVSDQQLTIVSGKSLVEHKEHSLTSLPTPVKQKHRPAKKNFSQIELEV